MDFEPLNAIMAPGNVSAEVVVCPGRLGNLHFSALQIDVEGFRSPCVLTLALPAIGFRAPSEQVDADDLYAAIAQGINAAQVSVEVSEHAGGGPKRLVALQA